MSNMPEPTGGTTCNSITVTGDTYDWPTRPIVGAD